MGVKRQNNTNYCQTENNSTITQFSVRFINMWVCNPLKDFD